MKIVHIDFTGPYTDDAGYQENLLPICDVLNGNDVTILAENTYWKNGEILTLDADAELNYTTSEKVEVIRKPLVFFFTHFLSEKIRAVKDIKKILEELNPDVIFLHCLQTWAGIDVCKYIKAHPKVYFIVDSHTDYYNSARTFFSRRLLHGVLYKYIAKRIEKYADKIFYITPETKSFLETIYGFKNNKMEFLPLGGKVLSLKERNEYSLKARKKYGFDAKTLIFLHSGKMDKAKKTLEVIQAFKNSEIKDAKLLLVGSLDESIREQVLEEIKNFQDMQFLGWKTYEELGELLCLADLYVQPGSQSATAEHAICCGTAVILDNVESYRVYEVDLGWLINQSYEMSIIFKKIREDPNILETKKDNCRMYAKQYFDYMQQSKKILKYVKEEQQKV